MTKFEEVLELAKRRGFFWPSFSIYGGISGFMDYGPLVTMLKDNVIRTWRENYLKLGAVTIDTPNITPEPVFRASGHIERFSDIAARCSKCGYKSKLESLLPADSGIPKNIEEAKEIVEKYKITCPVCGSRITEVYDFNLMFRLNSGDVTNLYLRPETAQGIFVNFKLLLNQNRGRIPMITAQLGKGFRNEISPRQGLIRMREIFMGEIEAFLDPETNNFKISDDGSEISFLPNTLKPVRMTISRAVEDSMINGDHAFFLSQTYNILRSCGIKPESIRFRQHRKDELSHYSSDCWDAEINMDGEWIETVGIADRGVYDLSRHQQFSGEKMTVKSGDREFIPRVIEPAYGIDRISFFILYDSYYRRENGFKVLKLAPDIAPYHAAFFPLQNKDGVNDLAWSVYEKIREIDPYVIYDDAGSIGKRYARQDEIGTPYCIVFDYESKDDGTVTIRERDSTKQIRIRYADLERAELFRNRNPFPQFYRN